VVILNAFLDPQNEGVTADLSWRPSVEKLREILVGGRGVCGEPESPLLRSLRVMWLLWTHMRGYVKLLVTTNGTHVPRSTEVALESAFSDGSACFLYNWRDQEPLLRSIADGVLK
jgi:hypothetical protein